ncbi:MAG: hypothetical protein JWQ68_2001 [Cryobacterium sp.]|jgi:competence protein ComEA|nr:hypothetical protein [Cryobacterium sp.]
MEPAPTSELASLDPAARIGPRPRLRLGIGAAVVLLLVAMVAAVVISAVGQQSGQRILAPQPPAASEISKPVTGLPPDGAPARSGGAIIFIHVLGAVTHPGLFELGEGSRVIDVISAAGGLTDAADPAGVNLARPVSDGEQLYIPQLGELLPPSATQSSGGGSGAGGAQGTAGGASGADHRVSLSSATLAELDTLPRIGLAMAQRIIDYRDANGPFGSVDDLRNVTGIGQKTFDALKDLVTA